MKLKLKYLTYKKSKSGKLLAYVRRKGFKTTPVVDLAGKSMEMAATKDFVEAYERAIAKMQGNVFESPCVPGTIDELIRDYQQSHKFQTKAASTQKSYARYCEVISKHWGHIAAKDITPAAVAAFQDKFSSTPRMADLYVTTLRNLFTLAIRQGTVQSNPALDIEPQHTKTPFKTWTDEEIKKAIAETPAHIGRVLKWLWRTGLRLGDCLSIERSMIVDGVLHITIEKTKVDLRIPLHSDLLEDLHSGATPIRHVLLSSKKRKWTRDGFESSAAPALKAVFGADKKPLHGIRKLAVVSLIEAGCSVPEVAAITGQTKQMVEHYARDFDRSKLAKSGMKKWEAS